MARPKEFDPLQKLDSAVDLFWERGYEGTSISSLVSVMGVNRASMYATYGDKEKLYYQSLGRYHVRVIGPMLEPLWDRHIPGIKAVEMAFDNLLDRLVNMNHPRGCMVAVASMDGPRGNAELERKLSEILEDFESGFYQALRRAQIEQALDVSKDPRQLARVFMAAMQGLATLGRLKPERGMLRDIIDANLALLTKAQPTQP